MPPNQRPRRVVRSVNADYLERLRSLKWRRRAYCFAMVGAVLSALVVFELASGFNPKLQRLFLLVPGCAILLMVVLAIRCALSACPECGREFFSRGFLTVSILTRKCVHCGLPLKVRCAWTAEDRARVSEWLHNAGPGQPLPDTGLTCPSCAYPLRGLTEQQCPECGMQFTLKDLVEL